MKILVIGAGLSGCSVARILKDKGHEISILEKKDKIGGLCVTEVNKNGIKYEPFGARTFHTKDKKIFDFALRFGKFNDYKHRKGMMINGKLFPFPLTRSSIEKFEEKELIKKELENRPLEIDTGNFETACLSIFGKTLYDYFIKNYTSTMWGINPKNLTAEWAPKRLEFRESESDQLFEGQYQGLPVDGYSVWLEKMIEGIEVIKECNYNDFELIIFTSPIDEAMNYRFGNLQYRSLNFLYFDDGKWEEDKYGTINLPQNCRYIRKANFKVLHQQESEHNYIQYQAPVEASDSNIPMYPVNTRLNESKFDDYLWDVCRTNNLLPLGRLACFKYLDMDKAISMAFDIADLVGDYNNMDEFQKHFAITNIRNKY